MGRPIPFKTNDRIRCRQGKGDMNVDIIFLHRSSQVQLMNVIFVYMQIDNVPSSMLFA